ncbi:MAG: glycosyltransferase [Bacteroidales bacterium]|nr:glycosyltransferase [Bacteroidales bacterium]
MKILVVLSRIPYPLDKGDKLRAFHQIKELAKNNDIYLFCLNNTKINPKSETILKTFVKEIIIGQFNKWDFILGMTQSLLDGTPFQTGYFTHKKNIKKFTYFSKKVNPDVIYYQFVRTAKYSNINYPKVLDFQDALSTNMKRRASKSSFLLKCLFNIEAKRLQKYEAKMFDIFNKLTIIVETDKKEIKHPSQDEITVISNGVDDSYFNYKNNNNKEFDIIFSGGMSYAPNSVAAIFLATEIMPLVWEKLPNIKLVIAGANPTTSVQCLSSENIKVTGWVDDMKEYYAKSKIFVAPMQIGTGLQNKLLEAMAMKLPCISSPLANEALGATHNENILIASSPKEYADSIINLLQNPSLADQIAQKGNNFVRENYRWETYGSQLESILKQVAGKVI